MSSPLPDNAPRLPYAHCMSVACRTCVCTLISASHARDQPTRHLPGKTTSHSLRMVQLRAGHPFLAVCRCRCLELTQRQNLHCAVLTAIPRTMHSLSRDDPVFHAKISLRNRAAGILTVEPTSHLHAGGPTAADAQRPRLGALEGWLAACPMKHPPLRGAWPCWPPAPSLGAGLLSGLRAGFSLLSRHPQRMIGSQGDTSRSHSTRPRCRNRMQLDTFA
jgi:hypothetical protein